MKEIIHDKQRCPCNHCRIDRHFDTFNSYMARDDLIGAHVELKTIADVLLNTRDMQ